MRWWLPLLIIPFLSGCAESALSEAQVVVDGGAVQADDEVLFQMDSRPTAAMYEANGRDHPGFYSAHDLLFEWADIHGHTLETQWFDSEFGFGFALCAIDDVPPRIDNGTARGCFERGGFWAISQNGEDAMLGMSDLEVAPGGEVAFTWTAT